MFKNKVYGVNSKINSNSTNLTIRSNLNLDKSFTGIKFKHSTNITSKIYRVLIYGIVSKACYDVCVF